MPGVVASRDIYPGEVIHAEKPFVKVLKRKFKSICCESCGERAFNLKACKECLAVKYCDKTCQIKDWRDGHKLECAHLKKLPEDGCDFLRLIGRLILKIKGKNWKDIKVCIMGTVYTFDDIDSHYEFMKSPRQTLRWKDCKADLVSYIGSENMPDDVDFMKIYGKVDSRLLSTKRSFDGVSFLQFYIGRAMFDVVCIPNANFFVKDDMLSLRAIKKINKGTDKITFRFKILSATSSFNAKEWELPCECTDCSLPYGESVFSKILDEDKAFSVICATEKILTFEELVPDCDNFTFFRNKVDALLRKQEGVLGKSNILRLRLLSMRCFRLNDHEDESPWVRTKLLCELKNTISEIFGERYSEMEDIYNALGILYHELGYFEEGARFINKAISYTLDYPIREFFFT